MTSLVDFFFETIPFMVGSLLLGACLLDFLYYRLPNKLFYAIFYLFPLYILLSFKFHLMSHYLVFVGSILIGFGLFATTLIGGGDAKLLAAVSLWVGWNDFAPFLVWVLVLGLMISCLYILFSKKIYRLTAKVRQGIQNQRLLKKGVQFFVSDIDHIESEVIALQQKRMIPYGISIAGAGLLILLKGMM